MSHDPVKDALKHLFGGDEKKEAPQPQQPASEQPASSGGWDAAGSAGASLAPETPAQDYTPSRDFSPSSDYNSATAAPDQTSQAPVTSVPEPAVAAPQPAPAPSGSGDVEQINGHAVGFAFLRYYREHPEIGQPIDEQHGDVGGYQMFENAILHWNGSNVEVEWRAGHQAQGQGGRTYTVNEGDNLSAIAQQVYGDASQWHRIYEANRDKISDPNLIHPGQQLQIP